MQLRLSVLIAFLLAGVAPMAQAVFVPVGLEALDTCHLKFIAADSRDASALIIGPCNLFVQDQAALNSSLTGTDGEIWSSLGGFQ